MQIILLEKVLNVGQLGEVVKVKDGYARNFLIPQGKARRSQFLGLGFFEFSTACFKLSHIGFGRAASFTLWNQKVTGVTIFDFTQFTQLNDVEHFFQ